MRILMLFLVFSTCLYAAESESLFRSVDVFRNIFSGVLREECKTCNEESLYKLLLYPTPGMLAPLEYDRPDLDPFANKRQLLQKIRPSNLYRESLRHPFVEEGLPDSNSLAQEPVTFVLIPGFFSEFIQRRPFEEVLEKDSSFKRRWQKALDAMPEEGKRVQIFSMQALSYIDVSLGDIVDVGSIDGAGDQELVRYILLKPQFGSFETIGSLNEKLPLYKERITRIFDAIGMPDSFYLIGYSQGANIALHLCSHLHMQKIDLPWANKLKGVVSLGGAVFGAEPSEMLDSPGESLHALMTELKTLAARLEDNYSSVYELPQIMWRNSNKWVSTLSKLEQFSRMSKPKSGLDSEQIPSSYQDYFGIYGVVLKSFYQHFKVQTVALEYFGNIKRFKMFVTKTYESASALKPKSRLEWWKNHELPPHLKYFVLNAAMADPYPEFVDSALAKSVWYGPLDGPDYALLRSGFYELLRRTNISLNDSQVIWHQAMLWPKLHQDLNAKQEKYHVDYLGILGSHHWGIAFPVALETRENLANPVPRDLLLKALALTIKQTDPRN